MSFNGKFLRQALLIDAAISGATGLVMMVGAATLAGLLELPAALLFWVGLSFIPFALCVAYLARQDRPPHAAVMTVIVLNALWAVDCIAAVALGLVDPNPLGVAFIVAQAVVVGVFAEAQFIGLRRTSASAAVTV